MTDGVILNEGTGGVTAATDDCGVAGHTQIVKLAISTDGSATPISADGTNGLDVDVTRVIPGTTSTALGKAEDAAHSSGDTGVMALAVRQDTATQLAGTDGDYSPLITDASGRLHVNVGASALPTGAATAAKQPALGTAGAASADVLTIQGVASMTPLQIADNGGSLTVDGTVGISGTVTVGSHAVTNAGTFAVQASQSGTWTVQIGNTANTTPILASLHDGTTKASVADLTNANPLHVAIVDATGDQIVSFGGGTQYTEDAAAAANPVGTATILVRADTPAAVTSADGDNVAQRGTDYGAAYVQVVDSSGNYIDTFGGSGGTAAADGATFTRGTTQVTPAGAAVESSAPTLTSGDVAALSQDTAGNLRVRVEAGGVAGVSEDAASASGDEGVLVMAVRRDTAAVGSGADGDYSTVNVNSSGRLYTTATVDAALPAGTNNIGDVDVLTLPNVTLAAGTNTNEVVGDAADDAAAAGNPVSIGGYAIQTDGTDPGTVSAEGDVTRLRTDMQRVLLVNVTNPRMWQASADYASAQTNASVKAAPGAGLSLYVTDLVLSNGATAGNITLLDGSGGTVLFEIYPAINGGVAHSFRNPIRLTANTALCITSTTVTTHSINVCGYIAP